MLTKSVTVSVTELFLSSIGMKVNGHYCWDILLSQQNVSCYYHVVYDNFVFEQESAQLRLAFNTVQLLQCNTLNFLSPELRPNNSPELNSTDYEI